MNIGEKIKGYRKKQGLTLDELSLKSSVSKSMLSQIERNQKNPTINILCQIAEALDMSASQLLEDNQKGEVILIRNEKRSSFTDEISGCTRTILSPAFPSKGIEFIQYTIPEGGSTGVFPAHKGNVKEYVYVVEGRLQVTLGGKQTFVLETADSLYFEANVEHKMDNIGKGRCQYFLVIDSNLREVNL